MLCSQTRSKSFAKRDVLAESIYNLVPKSQPCHERHLRYQSKYNPDVKEFYESIRQPHKTMGYAKTPLAPPTEYLKKRSKEPKLVGAKPFSYPDKDHRKPPIPKPLKSTLGVPAKNFIRENVQNVCRKPTTIPAKKIVETPKGDVVELEFSGLVPKYCCKKDFGKIPKYLEKRQEDMDHCAQEQEHTLREEHASRAPIKLEDGEKANILEGLHKNWNQLNTEYLRLPLCTDTIRKKAHKVDLERRLAAIEKDIALLERHQELYVYNGPQ